MDEPSYRAHGERVDDVAQHARVRVDLPEPRPRAFRRVVGEPPGPVDADGIDVAVAVEDVVDDLEEHPELVAERTPRGLRVLGHAGCPERHRDAAVEEAAG